MLVKKIGQMLGLRLLESDWIQSSHIYYLQFMDFFILIVIGECGRLRWMSLCVCVYVDPIYHWMSKYATIWCVSSLVRRPPRSPAPSQWWKTFQPSTSTNPTWTYTHTHTVGGRAPTSEFHEPNNIRAQYVMWHMSETNRQPHTPAWL